MIYNDDFVWLHFPKCAGTLVENIFDKYLNGLKNLHQDPVGLTLDPGVSWHDSLEDRAERSKEFSLGDRDIVIPVRKLPSWLVSRYCFEVQRSPSLPHDKQMLFQARFLESNGYRNNADYYMKKYVPEAVLNGSNRVRFLRVENFKTDFYSIFGSYLDLSVIPEEVFDKNVNKSKKCLDSRFIEQLRSSGVYQYAPYWEQVEALAYSS